MIKKEVTFKELVLKGYLEYLDIDEENNAYIALRRNLTHKILLYYYNITINKQFLIK